MGGVVGDGCGKEARARAREDEGIPTTVLGMKKMGGCTFLIVLRDAAASAWTPKSSWRRRSRFSQDPVQMV
jgi:hypothetical protein